MNIKCAACGEEWDPGIEQKYVPRTFHHHAGKDCPLREMGPICWREIVAINAAIEQVRKDERKPEECKHYDPDGFMACVLRGVCVPKQCCPCAAFEKKEG